MKHCADPTRCSVCIGAPARRVVIAGGMVVIDGVAMKPRGAQSRLDAARAKRGTRNSARRSR